MRALFRDIAVRVRKLAHISPQVWVASIVLLTIALANIWAWQAWHQQTTPAVAHQTKSVKQTPKQQKTATATETSSPVDSDTLASTSPVSNSTGAAAPKAKASSRVLNISVDTIEIYKKPAGVNLTIKPNATRSTPFTISTADGASVYLPFSNESAGIITTTAQGTTPYRQSWPMVGESSYASVGTFNYTLTAQTASGVKYSGTIKVIVKPMPIFTINGYGLVMYTAGDEASLYFGNGQPAEFDLSAVADFMPTFTVIGDGVSCTISLSDDATMGDDCGSTDAGPIPSGIYSFTAVFENRFQRIELPLTVYAS